MRFVLNAGIGDLILCHAMLAPLAATGRHSVCLSRRAIDDARSEAYLPFARRLMALLFDGFELDGEADVIGLDPLILMQIGFRPALPTLAHVLPAGRPVCERPYLAVSTKVRGLERARYDAISGRMLAALRGIARRVPLVLIGEREIGQNAEYRHHGESLVYSIYDDLKGLPCLDLTVPELGITPPSWRQFRQDCLTMREAAGVVALGSGGNVTMAISTGAPFGFIDGTEMSSYLSRVNDLPLLDTAEQFLTLLEAMQ